MNWAAKNYNLPNFFSKKMIIDYYEFSKAFFIICSQYLQKVFSNELFFITVYFGWYII